MIGRMPAIGFILAFSLCLALIPNESFGRSGFSGRPFPIASNFRRKVLRPPYLYGPPDYIGPNDQPSYADPETLTGPFPNRIDSVDVHHPGCRSYPVTVPSENGGTRLINILRC
jgi:hypothetical protein